MTAAQANSHEDEALWDRVRGAQLLRQAVRSAAEAEIGVLEPKGNINILRFQSFAKIGAKSVAHAYDHDLNPICCYDRTSLSKPTAPVPKWTLAQRTNTKRWIAPASYQQFGRAPRVFDLNGIDALARCRHASVQFSHYFSSAGHSASYLHGVGVPGY